MQEMKKRLPPIAISKEDKVRLRNLAYSAIDRVPEVADELLQEVERAKTSSHANTVRMGSTVEFETDTGMHHTIRLVFPAEADISAKRISVLTPIGTALLGLSAGQRMQFTDREGRERQLTIIAVTD